MARFGKQPHDVHREHAHNSTWIRWEYIEGKHLKSVVEVVALLTWHWTNVVKETPGILRGRPRPKLFQQWPWAEVDVVVCL